MSSYRGPDTRPGGKVEVFGKAVPSAIGGMGAANANTMLNRSAGGTDLSNWNECRVSEFPTIKFEEEDMEGLDEAKVAAVMKAAHNTEPSPKDVGNVLAVVQSLRARGVTAQKVGMEYGQCLVRVPKKEG